MRWLGSKVARKIIKGPVKVEEFLPDIQAELLLMCLQANIAEKLD
jgi:hypothetical protein